MLKAAHARCPSYELPAASCLLLMLQAAAVDAAVDAAIDAEINAAINHC